MKLLSRTLPALRDWAKSLSGVPSTVGGWYPLVREGFAGAWQRDTKVNYNSVLSFHADFACRTLIASDIAKLRIKLMNKRTDGTWAETQNTAYSPVLRKPNPFQNRIQFLESWVLSKLQSGNTYVLIDRHGSENVKHLYVLDPNRVKPLIADDGSVFYQLQSDNIAGLPHDVIVPAREIIHDRFNCMFHPLVGMSPIFANGLAAMQGLSIQQQATRLFQNGAQPGGILTAPNRIDPATAERLKAKFEAEFQGNNAGRVAVLGDGLKYEKMALSAVEGQVIEQLKWTDVVVCSTYHVPPYKIGAGQMPASTNTQALNLEYYTQCLQVLIEAIELCLDEGLRMDEKTGTELDVEGLLRMDSVSLMTMIKEGVGAAVFSPDEARRRFDLPPVPGGGTPYLQQQNYSLVALAKRDAKDDPFAKSGTNLASEIDSDDDDSDGGDDTVGKHWADQISQRARALATSS
jgi:HK97 family phage portal protein